jgi:hypothetical protein
MTLGNAAAARVRLIVWCRDCRHRVEHDPAEMAERYGAETPGSELAQAARLLQLRLKADRLCRDRRPVLTAGMTLPRVQPIIPTWRKQPFDGPGWLFDVKYDGFRAFLTASY